MENHLLIVVIVMSFFVIGLCLICKKLWDSSKSLKIQLQRLSGIEKENDANKEKIISLNQWKNETEVKIPLWESKEKVFDENDELKKEISDNSAKALKIKSNIEALESKYKILEEYHLFEESGIFNYKFNFQDIEEYANSLAIVKEYQKVLIKDFKAMSTRAKGLVGSPLIKSLSKLALLAFNSSGDLIVNSVKYNNYDTCVDKFEKLFNKINDHLAPFESHITQEYYSSKIKELALAMEFEEEKQRVKEEQDEIKAQMKEEQKILAEAEKARDKAIEEEEKLELALEIARKEIQGKAEEERSAYEEKIKALEEQLKSAHENTERAISNAQITSVGHVYIISNIGSFGENVYKIGMTRRDDPMDRVRELGDASVPFKFDVHAMMFSEDARKLEADLHNVFNKSRVNKVNMRKEFFSVSLNEIEKACEELGCDIRITKLAEAREYRESVEKDELVA